MHEHSDACLAYNELHELCCRDLPGDRLPNADRWIVLTRDDERLEVFTDSASDAFALARADGKVPRMVESAPRHFAPDHPFYNERTQR